MAKNIYPEFPLFPQDFISSFSCRRMSPDVFGFFCWFLMHSWIYAEKPCHLPNDPEKIESIFPKTFDLQLIINCLSTLKQNGKIIETDDKKYLYNLRLLEEYQKLINRSNIYSKNKKGKGLKSLKKQKHTTIDNQLIINSESKDNQADNDNDSDNDTSSLNLNSNVSNINNVNNICEAGNPEPVKKPKKEKSAFPTDSFEYQFSEKIYKSLTAGTGAIITPAKIQSGASVVDLMLRVDKRDGQWLEKTLQAVLDAPERNGFCWRRVIKSAGKFRDHTISGNIHPEMNASSFNKNGSQGFKMRNDNFLDIPEA